MSKVIAVNAGSSSLKFTIFDIIPFTAENINSNYPAVMLKFTA